GGGRPAASRVGRPPLRGNAQPAARPDRPRPACVRAGGLSRGRIRWGSARETKADTPPREWLKGPGPVAGPLAARPVPPEGCPMRLRPPPLVFSCPVLLIAGALTGCGHAPGQGDAGQ